ncbi:MAG: OmpA family protein [Rikenellaceae bacterium]|nr:OmpA family protein [Rikenellaceae bacterium]
MIYYLANYTQKWDQVYARADFMFNFRNAVGSYRYDRFYNAIPYVDVGAAWVLNCDDKYGEDFSDRSAVLAAGLLNTFRHNFDLFLEGKYSFVTDDYDRQVTNNKHDGMLGVTAGLIWRIGKAGARPFRNEIVAKTYLTRLYKPEVTVVKEVVVEEKVVERASADALNTQIAVFFELGDATVTPRGKVNLQYAAEMVKNNPGQFRVVGMADSQTGSAALNQRLSERRAEAVRSILVKEYGVSDSKLVIEAIGGVAYMHPDYVNRAVIIMPEK